MRPFRHVLGIVSACVLMTMMFLTFADVIGRKLVGSSIPGVVEVTELLMLALIFFALPLTSLAGQHIVFDLLDKVFSGLTQRWLHAIANLITASALAAGAWLVWIRAGRTIEQGDITSSLGIPLGPFYYGAAACLLLTALVHLWLLGQPLRDAPQEGA